MKNSSLAALAFTLTLSACGRERAALPAAPASAEANAVGVKAIKPRGDGGNVVRATGELRARHEAVLSSEASGRILRFAVDVGARVKKGDLLMELDSSTARIQVAQARAARAVAAAAHASVAADLERTEELARGEAASPAMLEKAQLGEQQAAASLQQGTVAVAAAEDQLAKTTLRAPFDGFITARFKSTGEYVAMMPPTAVMAMVDVATVEVRAAVPESVVDLLTIGAELDATVSPSDKPFKARVRSIGASVDAATRTVDVRADPVRPLFKELRPGALVQIRLTAANQKGLFLPAEAVHREDGKSFVWAVVGSEARRRQVQVEQLDPGTFHVLTGVGAEDLIVAQSGSGLSEGARVRVQE
jgi:membrane fusion protein (multidrug efflux system)